jgi:hypothetical protein
MADYQIIPLTGTASQTCSVSLGNQPCSIDVFTKHIQVPVIPGHGVSDPPQSGGTIVTVPPVYGEIDPIFLNLRVNDKPIVSGVLARNNVRLIRGFCATLPIFIGDLSFHDIEGNEEPQWPGLGQRWFLLYWPWPDRVRVPVPGNMSGSFVLGLSILGGSDVL